MKLVQDANITSGLNDFLAVNDLTHDQLVNKYDLTYETNIHNIYYYVNQFYHKILAVMSISSTVD